MIPFSQRLYCPINAACEATGIGRSKLYAMIKAGTVRTVRIGGRQHVVVESLLDLARGEREGGP